MAGALIAAFMGGCSPPTPNTSTTGNPTVPEPRMDIDIHSFARPSEARVTHVALDLKADFVAKRLSGRATLKLQRAANAKEIVLDSRDLSIKSVGGCGRADAHLLAWRARSCPWTFDHCHAAAGRRRNRRDLSRRARPPLRCSGWNPSQTDGRKQPYLFSQGQAILTRTWIPTQDSPGIRQTYSARIVVPRELRAVMSAEQLTPDGVETPRGARFRVPPDATRSLRI